MDAHISMARCQLRILCLAMFLCRPLRPLYMYKVLLLWNVFSRPRVDLERIDHIVGNQPDLEMTDAANWSVAPPTYCKANDIRCSVSIGVVTRIAGTLTYSGLSQL